MLVIVIPFLVLVSPCQGFPEQMPDTAAIKDEEIESKGASLLKQEEKWASLLIDQEDKTASLLRQQEEKWASLLIDQEDKTASLLRQQEEKWTSFLRDQETEAASTMTELEHVKSVLRKQEQNILNQEQKLSHQERLLSQQEKKLLDQEDLLLRQGQTLSRQERLLQEQGARLPYQEGLLQQQLGTTIQELRHRDVGPRSFRDETSRHSTNMSQSQIPLTGTPSDSAPHDVMPRSDDTGPWEAVVSHISQQVTEMGADIQALKNSNTQQDQAIQDAQSSTFVHWGSSTCSNLSHTVYSGVVGGSWWQHSGSATNYLCLTMSPVFSSHPVPKWKAFLYGGEYETEDSHYYKDPVCSVCRSTLSTVVMIPGTNVCTPGWHLHYSGFLMAGSYDHIAGSEFICVDSKLESAARSDANQDGKVLFYTVTRCGSLPCGPYVNDKVVTCAVCSK